MAGCESGRRHRSRGSRSSRRRRCSERADSSRSAGRSRGSCRFSLACRFSRACRFSHACRFSRADGGRRAGRSRRRRTPARAGGTIRITGRRLPCRRESVVDVEASLQRLANATNRALGCRGGRCRGRDRGVPDVAVGTGDVTGNAVTCRQPKRRSGPPGCAIHSRALGPGRSGRKRRSTALRDCGGAAGLGSSRGGRCQKVRTRDGSGRTRHAPRGLDRCNPGGQCRSRAGHGQRRGPWPARGRRRGSDKDGAHSRGRALNRHAS